MAAAARVSLLPPSSLTDAQPLCTDQSLALAGGWGAYQRYLMLILGAAMAVCSSHMLAPIFLVPALQKAWELSTLQTTLVTGVYFVGYCIGVFAWAAVSDSSGRRPAILMAFTLGNVTGIASFLAPEFWTFATLRFLCGVGVAGAKNGCFLLGTEFVTPDARSRVGAWMAYAWLGGNLVLVLVAWLLQSQPWRALILTYLPAVGVQILLPRILPESPRFAIVAGDMEQARQQLLAVFHANGRTPPEPFCLMRPPPSPYPDSEAQRKSAASMFQLWMPATRIKTAVVGVCQGACTMVFYAITFDKRFNSFAGELHLGALLGCLVELPAYLTLEPITNRCGRKRSYSTYLALSAVCLLLLHVDSPEEPRRTQPLTVPLHEHAFRQRHEHALALTSEDHRPAAARAKAAIPHVERDRNEGTLELRLDAPSRGVASRSRREHGDATDSDSVLENGGELEVDRFALACALGGRFTAVAATNVAYIVSAELFPTSCRNSALGWGSGCGRLGAILAPIVMLNATSPLLLFAVVSLIAAALVWLLPESVGLTLTDVPLSWEVSEHECEGTSDGYPDASPVLCGCNARGVHAAAKLASSSQTAGPPSLSLAE